VQVSITVRQDKRVKAAIATIGGDAWTKIKYTDAIFDPDTGRWISAAEVAEIPFTASWVFSFVWGLGWGAAPTVLQSAASQAGVRLCAAFADTAQAILVTLWNGAMAIGGVLGGLVVTRLGVQALPNAAVLLGGVGLVVIVTAHQHAFPGHRKPESP